MPNNWNGNGHKPVNGSVVSNNGHYSNGHSERAASVEFAGRKIGPREPALIVAEIGLNHCGKMDRALKLIEAAAAAGADAVKLQKRTPRELLTKEAYHQSYYNNGNSFGLTYGKHREALEFDREAYKDLLAASRELGMELFASVWDLTSLHEMITLGCEAIKIPSADLTNEPLLAATAEFNKPVFISTGMSKPKEIDRAVSLLKRLEVPTVLFHCVSVYPTPVEQTQLETLAYYAHKYGLPLGYSGHEMELAISVAARTLGACVIEKHFTLDRSWKGGDQKISLLPEEFARLVEDIRIVEKGFTGVREGIVDGEQKQRKKLAKSIVARRNIKAGEIIDLDMISCKCPGGGLSPQNIHRLVGRKAKRDISTDEYLLESQLEEVDVAQPSIERSVRV